MERNEQIQVSFRVRPLSSLESKDHESNIWKLHGNSISLKPQWLQVLRDHKRISKISKSYTYDHCFSTKSTNKEVYKTMARRLTLASLDGYNGTIFVYGQTGSGKTFTMMGQELCDVPDNSFRSFSEKGILILAIEDLFTRVKMNLDKQFFFTCSYLQIYNEQVFDLLSDAENKSDSLTVNEDPERGFYVKALSEHIVSSLEEVLKYIEKGEAQRKFAATALNQHSSRSHTIFRLFVTSVSLQDVPAEDKNITTESVLNFVDLAGSERASTLHDPETVKRKAKSQSESQLTEGKYINTSLFYLCQVINKLAEKNHSRADMHIPYRNSNLTKILRSSLGGNSLTAIVCTATPTYSQFEMTFGTIRFGGMAKTITNKVAANIRNNKHAELLQTYQTDINTLKEQLEQAQVGSKLRAEETTATRKQLEERILKLTHMLFRRKEELPGQETPPEATSTL